VNAAELAKPAIAAVETGKTAFVPKNWEKTYFEWMRNIQPWCISRQLWWGHQIPAWYGPDGKVFVAESEIAAAVLAEKHYKKMVDLKRDEDVLDTWFSSALWPFSTLGWPVKTPELKRYYPTTVLVTGFDIIFFWVARMMMMGLHFMQEVPFRDVYIHALVRDEKGQKMSKSKGNVMDPLGLVDTYGADALRFTLAAMAAQGRDIKLSTNRVEGYRNFATKLWNASRFAEMNECVRRRDFDPATVKETLNRWIVGETERAARAVTEGIEAYKFNEAATAIYEFVWGVFCDWYLELIKPTLLSDNDTAKKEARATVAWTLDQVLKLLHPFMPFVTEELWHVTGGGALLALVAWPSPEGFGDAIADAEIGWVIDLISAIRSVRAEMNVNVPLPLVMIRVGDRVWERTQRWAGFIKRIARISEVKRTPVSKPGTIQLVVRGETVGLELSGLVDLAAERARLAKEMAKCDADIARVDAKLGNPNFVARAPEDVVEEEKEKREAAAARKVKIAEALQRLEGAA